MWIKGQMQYDQHSLQHHTHTLFGTYLGNFGRCGYQIIPKFNHLSVECLCSINIWHLIYLVGKMSITRQFLVSSQCLQPYIAILQALLYSQQCLRKIYLFSSMLDCINLPLYRFGCLLLGTGQFEYNGFIRAFLL